MHSICELFVNFHRQPRRLKIPGELNSFVAPGIILGFLGFPAESCNQGGDRWGKCDPGLLENESAGTYKPPRLRREEDTARLVSLFVPIIELKRRRDKLY
jgi:hypothetical protein